MSLQWPKDGEPVEVALRHDGPLQWAFSITQPPSLIASTGTAMTRLGAYRAAYRRVAKLRREVQRDQEIVRFRL